MFFYVLTGILFDLEMFTAFRNQCKIIILLINKLVATGFLVTLAVLVAYIIKEILLLDKKKLNVYPV